MAGMSMAEVTGVIGAITGGIALIVSLKSYALARSVKTLDLRLELEKAYNELDIVLSGIDEHLAHVHKSHTHVFAAVGLNNPGAMVLFEQEFAKDRDRLRGLLGAQPKRESSFEGLVAAALVKQIAGVHAFHLQVADLRGKYQKILDSDDERRKEIRASMDKRVG
jgi:hypothetical protein